MKNEAKGKTLREVYVGLCEKLRIRKNAHVLKLLPDDFVKLEEIDLSNTYVGRVGIKPVLEMMRWCPNVKKLGAADNFLSNESIIDLVTLLADHEGLNYLDLRRNPISHAAGKALSKFVSTKATIYGVLLQGTLINPALVRIIEKKAEVNKSRASGGFSAADSAAVAAPPPPLPDRSEATKKAAPKETLPALSRPLQLQAATAQAQEVDQTGRAPGRE
eukprot:RCo010634